MMQNALWLSGSALLLRAAGMLFQVYLSKRMGPAGLGLLQLVLTSCGFSSVLALAGAKITAMYLVAGAAGRNSEDGVAAALRCCLGYTAVISCAVAALSYCLSPQIARSFVQSPDALAALRGFALLLPGACFAAVMQGVCTALGKVRRQVCVELLERLCSVGLTVFLLRRADGALGPSLFAIVVGSAAPPWLSFLLLCLPERRRLFRHGGRRPPAVLRKLLRTSLPLALGDVLREGLNTVEQYLIPYGLGRFSSRALALAAYGTVRGMVFPVMLFPSAILYAAGDLLVPALSRCAVRRQSERIAQITGRCLRLCAIYAAAVAGVLYCAADELGLLLYRSAEAGRYLRLFSPMVLFLYLDAIVDGMQKGLGQQLYTVRYNTLTNVIDIVTLYTLLPRFGIVGYLISYTSSHLVNFFLSLRRLLLVTDGRPSLRALASLLGWALLCAAFSASLPPLALLPGLLLHTVSYLGLLLLGCRLLRLDRERDLRWLRASLRSAA